MAMVANASRVLGPEWKRVRCPHCGEWFWSRAEKLPLLTNCPGCLKPLVLERVEEL